MSSYISQQLKARIEKADHHRFCYCLTSEKNSGIPMTLDHIYPVSKGGKTTLFNPRLQKWSEHFRWSLDGTKIEGLTPIGRTTISVLKMNNPLIVTTRLRWVIVGWHPPEL